MQSTPQQIIKSTRKNLRLIMIETSITGGILAMSIFTPFFESIGLNNQQISETQMLYTIVLMLLNIPLGYVADRVSRKWANIIGDFGHAIAMLLYAQVGSFAGAVFCECLCGISSAFTNGVDQALIKHFIDKNNRQVDTEKEKISLRSKTAKVQICKQIFNAFLLALGGPIGAIDLRLAIALSSANCFAGGIISIFISDDSEKLQPKHKNPIKDILHVIKTAAKNRPLRIRIFAFAIMREMTHGVVWIVTPLFLRVGVPIELVSFAWVFNALMNILGAKLATLRSNKKRSDAQLVAIPTVLMTISMLTIGLNLNIVTVWLYGLMGIVQGWFSSIAAPMLQRYIKPSEQTSVISIAQTLAQLIYIPSVWLVGHMADIKLE